MGTITTGIGLISGINTAQLIDQLMGVEAQVKIPIQRKIAKTQASKTALLDVNARLLNLKNAGQKFRLQSIFRTASATSSVESILTALAGTEATPGNYSFIVKQLASTSQKLSKGFTDKSVTPLGLDALTFEFGAGKLARNIDLADLNGGDGVRRGKIVITDSAGGSATVNLSNATTMQEVLDRINDASGVSVTASIDGDRLRLVDGAGGGGSMSVANAGGSNAATDLGIVGTAVGGVLTGTQVNRLGGATNLTALNNGTGILVRNNVADFRIDVGGTVYDIDLGRVDAPITASTSLSDLNNGTGIAINSTSDDDFSIITTTGATVGINLGQVVVDGEVQDEKVETVGELLNRVNAELTEALGAGKVVLSLRADGKGFELTDTMMGTANPLRTIGAGANGNETAQDLGIYTGPTGGSGDTIVGSVVPSTVDTPEASTIQDVITRINDQTSGAVTASIGADGVSLRLTASGGGSIAVLAGAVDGSSYGTAISEKTLKGLGLLGLSGTGSIDGSRVLAGLGSVLASGLNGGAGLGGADSITITDRAGASFTLGGLDAYDSLSEIVNAINDAATANAVAVTLGVNGDGSGLQVIDSSGGSGVLDVAGTMASALGIKDTVAGDKLKGDNLQLRYMDESTLLSSLRGGKGIGTGKLKLTDSAGASAVLDIGTDARTVYDVMAEINSRGLFIEARINSNGDGIELVDTNTSPPVSAMKVESVSGSVGSNLGLVGAAETAGGNIVGSLAKTVEFDPSDALDDVVKKINDAGIGVNASIINAGSGAKPYMLNLTSAIGGRAGELVIDTGGVDLGLTTLSEAKDAEVFFGSNDPAKGILLRSGTNEVKDAVAGLTLNLVSASEQAVNVSVTRDTTTIMEAVKDFVTTINDVLGRINDYDSYDPDTEERGPLLGDPTVARIRTAVYGLVQGSAKGVTGDYTRLSQVGIKVGKNGELTVDEAKFLKAYEDAPDAVEALFAAYEKETVTNEEVAPGITISKFDETFSTVGFGDLFAQLVEGFTDPEKGAVTKADEGFQKVIDASNDRLEQIDERLLAKRARLEAQFVAMERALSQLQGQQGALASLSQIAANFAA
ncbi:MAG: flagellar filament capping protein FliD [Phycisphaerales bacterium]|nr:flagellar filament capping protein FliD [Phycisphaerales bacterium]